MFAIGKPGNQLKDMDTTLEKTVILWGQDDVLIRAVENLLITGRGWKVIRICDEWDDITLAQAVGQVTPDVLIVHEDAFDTDARLLIKFVHDYPKLKIITIGLGDNQMEIYNKHTIDIKEPSDLLAAIENDTAPNAKEGAQQKFPTQTIDTTTSVNAAGDRIKIRRGVIK